MALAKITFDIIKQLMPHIPSRPITMVTVGYPDCLISAETLSEIFGQDLGFRLTYRDDSDKIIAWHGLQGRLDKIPETKSLLKLLDIDLTVLDINEVRGGEIICDLNEPVAEELLGRFDVVLDGGTMEHCFNVGCVIKNLVAMAKVDGFVVHQNPLLVMNHGFFNFSPTFYHDFYTDNGHRFVSPVFGFIQDGLDYRTFEVPATRRFAKAPENSWITAVIQKGHDRKNVWPMQTKYKNSPSLGGG